MELGPLDPSLLCQQQYHISNDAMEGNVRCEIKIY